LLLLLLLRPLQVHNDYVDCCRWLGDLVLSKSVDYKVVLWPAHSLCCCRRAALNGVISRKQIVAPLLLSSLVQQPLPACLHRLHNILGGFTMPITWPSPVYTNMPWPLTVG